MGPFTCNLRSGSVNGCSQAWPSFESFNVYPRKHTFYIVCLVQSTPSFFFLVWLVGPKLMGPWAPPRLTPPLAVGLPTTPERNQLSLTKVECCLLCICLQQMTQSYIFQSPYITKLVGLFTCNLRSVSANGCSQGSPSSQAWPSFESFNIHLQVGNY